MRLKYMFAEKRKTFAHPFHVKSTCQPPVQNSVALENYWEETKLEIAWAIFRPQIDHILANERNAISTLKRNSKIKLKKADKGTTTVILDGVQKIDEGWQQLSNDKFYKPLSSPIRELTQRRRQRQRRRQKTMIWLVQWGKIFVLHVRHAPYHNSLT